MNTQPKMNSFKLKVFTHHASTDLKMLYQKEDIVTIH